MEVHETFVGGRRIGAGRGGYTGSDNPPVVGAAERGGEVRLRVVRNRTKGLSKGYIRQHVASEAEAIYTDEWIGYQGVGDEDTRHEVVNHALTGTLGQTSTRTRWRKYGPSASAGSSAATTRSVRSISPPNLDEMGFRFTIWSGIRLVTPFLDPIYMPVRPSGARRECSAPWASPRPASACCSRLARDARGRAGLARARGAI